MSSARFTFRALLVSACLAALLPLSTACDTEAGDPCVKGQACVCEEDCSEACEGDGCGFSCEFGADCEFSCPEGGCSVACDEGTSCALDCPGGGCQMACDAAADCSISDCAGGMCILTCDPTSASCENACGLDQGCVTGG